VIFDLKWLITNDGLIPVEKSINHKIEDYHRVIELKGAPDRKKMIQNSFQNAHFHLSLKIKNFPLPWAANKNVPAS
jgi:hypothetical protein